MSDYVWLKFQKVHEIRQTLDFKVRVPREVSEDIDKIDEVINDHYFCEHESKLVNSNEDFMRTRDTDPHTVEIEEVYVPPKEIGEENINEQ